jgi:hypothetical protein
MTKTEIENMRGFVAIISIFAIKFDPVAVLADNPDIVARAMAFGIPPGASGVHNLLAQASAEISRREIDKVYS